MKRMATERFKQTISMKAFGYFMKLDLGVCEFLPIRWFFRSLTYSLSPSPSSVSIAHCALSVWVFFVLPVRHPTISYKSCKLCCRFLHLFHQWCCFVYFPSLSLSAMPGIFHHRRLINERIKVRYVCTYINKKRNAHLYQKAVYAKCR